MIKKIIITIVAIAVIFAVYWFFIRMTKPKAIKFIVENGMYSSATGLNDFDETTLKAWVKAIKRTQQTFTVNGKVYNVMGGKAL